MKTRQPRRKDRLVLAAAVWPGLGAWHLTGRVGDKTLLGVPPGWDEGLPTLSSVGGRGGGPQPRRDAGRRGRLSAQTGERSSA